jgi:FAD/FMN-containing dehydrogenase
VITILDSETSRLERDLRAAVRGEVHFEDGYRAMYSTDAANYRQVPMCVILPLDAGDAQAAMRVCHHHGTPITPRAAEPA